MAQFAYEGRTRADGSPVASTVEAINKDEATRRLLSEGIEPTSVTAIAGSIGGISSFGDLGNIQIGGKRAKPAEMARFTRQMSTMVAAGVPIMRALDISSAGVKSAFAKDAIASVRADVQQGVPLADAFGRHDKVFNQLYVSLVTAGEQGGNLPLALERLADQMDAANTLRREVKGAMIYPIGTLVFAGIVFFAMMMFVVPVFATIFAQGGAKLPALTQALVEISNFTRKAFWYPLQGVLWLPRKAGVVSTSLYEHKADSAILGLLNVAGWCAFDFYLLRGIRRLFDVPEVRAKWDLFKLKVPGGVGNLAFKVCAARFTRTFATLQEAGVGVLTALEVSGPTAGNVVVQGKITKAGEMIQRLGRSTSEALRESDTLPEDACAMLIAGETSGRLDTMLDRVALNYEEEVATTVKSLKSLMEPFLIIVIGGIVGTLVIALYLPIFNVYKTIH